MKLSMCLFKYFTGKEKGSMMHLLGAICSCVMMALLVVIFASWMANIDHKNSLDHIARKYILRMEAKGYLDQMDQSSMQTELTEKGCSGLNFSGSTVSRVNYGSELVLNVTGQLKIYNYQVLDIFSISMDTGEITFVLNRTSTAKH